MEFVILATILTTTGVISFLNWFFAQKNKAEVIKTAEKIESYAKIQKDNTEKLIGILEKTFVPDPKPVKNDIDTKDETIEFSESNPIDLSKDLKFEVEGGDSQIPSGYKGN